MLTIRLTFPWGRYYAHPWGQNPARITEAEWPPSPWRLLRALAAAWFQSNPGREPSNQLLATLDVLGRELPSFVLPKVSFSRSIHYQPNYGATPTDDVALAKYKRVRHENHFAAVAGDVLVRWQLDGVDSETKTSVCTLLNSISGRVTYFGRAESICELSVEDGSDLNFPEARVVTQQNEPSRRISADCRDVFCPNPRDFRAADLWKRRDSTDAGGAAPKHLVQDLIDAPQPLPDGSAWYSYRMPDGWPERFVIRHAVTKRRAPQNESIVARLVEFRLPCRVPIPIKHVVSIASGFRRAAINNHKLKSYALSGHDSPDGKDRGHAHAFYLPIPDPTGQFLDGLRVWCQFGFNQRELDALTSVGPIRWADGQFPARPVATSADLGLPEKRASRWKSITPFVPPRHWFRKSATSGKTRQRESPERQLQRLFDENGMDLPASISRSDYSWDVCKIHIPSSCAGDGGPTHRVGVYLTCEFATPISLPLPAFGHSSHFGLGQFAAADG